MWRFMFPPLKERGPHEALTTSECGSQRSDLKYVLNASWVWSHLCLEQTPAGHSLTHDSFGFGQKVGSNISDQIKANDSLISKNGCKPESATLTRTKTVSWGFLFPVIVLKWPAAVTSRLHPAVQPLLYEWLRICNAVRCLKLPLQRDQHRTVAQLQLSLWAWSAMWAPVTPRGEEQNCFLFHALSLLWSEASAVHFAFVETLSE